MGACIACARMHVCVFTCTTREKRERWKEGNLAGKVKQQKKTATQAHVGTDTENE